MNKNTKELTITKVENLTENQAAEISSEQMTIKEHNVYFIDLAEYYMKAFGYSCLVFKNGHHIYYANDYELHHRGKTHEQLRDIYINELNAKLFTEAEILEPIKDYEEYRRKSYYLHNYYGMQTDYLSCFQIFHTSKEKEDFEKQTETMTLNRVAFAYMSDKDFIKHHCELYSTLEENAEKLNGDYEYQKSAFLYEMYNHEYGINYQADYDTLSCFGKIGWHDGDLNMYFKELEFTEVQKRAYLDARKQYFKETINADY